MTIRTVPLRPLTFKQKGREVVFARDAVKCVKLLRLKARTFSNPTFDVPERWQVDVNDVTVYIGTEKGARRHQERALRYVR